MDRRTTVLASVFGVVVIGALLSSVAYPLIREHVWIDPAHIAREQRELDKLEDLEARVNEARLHYRDVVARLASFDVGVVETDVREALNELIDKYELENAKVTRGRPSSAGKTGLTKMTLTVTATCSLQSAVEFLKEVSEMPQLIRVGNAAISPMRKSGAGRKGYKKGTVSLRAPIEVMVLPRQKVVGPIDVKTLTQPDTFVRHQGQAYATIWEANPFWAYVPPIPLRVTAGPAVNVKTGKKRVMLTVKASGGEGPYTYRWEPADGLSDPTRPKPKVDTKKPFNRTYKVTATDVNGKTAVGSVRVTVADPRPKPVKVATKPPAPTPRKPAKKVDKRWKDRKYMQVRMALLQAAGAERIDELMIYNNRAKETKYYTIGDEFNGGELVFVHPTGGVVRRMDEYFLYPIGNWVDEDISVKTGGDAAREYPQLLAAADRHGVIFDGPIDAENDVSPVGPGDGAEDGANETAPDDKGTGGDGRSEVRPAMPRGSGAQEQAPKSAQATRAPAKPETEAQRKLRMAKRRRRAAAQRRATPSNKYKPR